MRCTKVLRLKRSQLRRVGIVGSVVVAVVVAAVVV